MVRKGKRNNYEKGADKERRIMNKFRDKGMLSFRSAGSHSPIDVFALDIENKTIWLIQSKPKSMSDNAKQKIYDEIKKYMGEYLVVVGVE